MKSLAPYALAMVASFSVAHVSEPITGRVQAEYTIYAGDLGEERPATKTDRKLSLELSGQAAKEIFDSIYPDASVTCSAEKGERLRRKKNLWCSYHPKDGYRCYMGFNLRTGDSIPGASC